MSNQTETTPAADPVVHLDAEGKPQPVPVNPLQALEQNPVVQEGAEKMREHTAGDGSVTVRPAKRAPRKLQPTSNAKSPKKGKAAKEPEPQPAPHSASEPKFTRVFTATLLDLLSPHGFKQGTSKDPAVIVFSKNGTRVEVVNPSRPGGSKFAEWTVTRKSGKAVEGQGRDELADALGVPQLTR